VHHKPLTMHEFPAVDLFCPSSAGRAATGTFSIISGL
jgi:hypothetical protein